ncbi:MAG: glycoside hydrolase family 16 protein [Candidatus Sumerlaeota bacterium]|nr:glycoside hydrolase family 16 protein [Candidatus Sumerlaeota bacterium]
MISPMHRTLAPCATALVSLAMILMNAAGASPLDTAREKAPTGAKEDVFYDGFDGGKLDPGKWMIARRQWGGKGKNGGVVAENVSTRDGHVVLEAHGDQYQGPVKGVEKRGKDFVEIDEGRRVGASIVTKDRFASGRYEVRARIPRHLGACSAFWTFYYDEVAPKPGPSESKPANARRKPKIINHEIDIELPGRPGRTPQGVGYDWMLFITWTGVGAKEDTSDRIQLPNALNDGEFHTYRFDWHTGGNGIAPSVVFFLDGKELRTVTTNVPSIAGHFWIGIWFPKGSTGEPDYDTETLDVDWARITPFHEPDDQFVEEAKFDNGFAPVDQWPAALRP